MVIRALATDEIEPKDVFKVWWKEARIGIMCGVTLGLVNGIRIFIQYHDLGIAIVIACTLCLTAVLAKSLGCFLPLLAKAIHLDPAYMASPLITTITDACSLAIYFNIALMVLNI